MLCSIFQAVRCAGSISSVIEKEIGCPSGARSVFPGRLIRRRCPISCTLSIDHLIEKSQGRVGQKNPCTHPSSSAPAVFHSLSVSDVVVLNDVKHLGFAENGVFEMRISAKAVLSDVKLGDSIAINGTCLTATEFDAAAASARPPKSSSSPARS
ncbi:hypothetical protein ACLOJK_040547 [Asimina triloba]